MDAGPFYLAGTPEADEFLAEEPFALLIGMVLDQQVPLEWAFSSPLELQRRLGEPLTPGALAELDPDRLVQLFSGPPALHRFPAAMAERVGRLSRLLLESYGGEAARLWADVSSGSELLARVKKLPGFGDQKARIFVALLGKRLGVTPPGWREAAGAFGVEGSWSSVADIDGPEALERVRATKRSVKAAAKKPPGAAEATEAAATRRRAPGTASGPAAPTATPSRATAGSRRAPRER